MQPEGELANDERNPCIGCGPANPAGLRLRFARRGDRVEASFRATETWQGWPGRLHSGVLYLALLETANWTVFGLTGRAGFPVRTSALEGKGWVPAGEVVALVGRVAQSAPVRVRAEALVEGRPVASLERDFDFPTRAEAARRLGYAEVPTVLEEMFPP